MRQDVLFVFHHWRTHSKETEFSSIRHSTIGRFMPLQITQRFVDKMSAHSSVAQVLLHVPRKVTLVSRGGKMRQYEQAGHMFCKSYVSLATELLLPASSGCQLRASMPFTRLKELWLCANLSEPKGYGVQIQRRVGAGSKSRKLKFLLTWGAKNC